MTCDYESIRRENKEEYGKGISRFGSRLLVDYAERTHFVFELLQNAEDALARRQDGWCGSRTVFFNLTETELRVSHFGQPFDERDVRGICGIDESTKELTDIGRFGIGFKSVYAFTNRPEIHSGDEDFAIENYVHPYAVSPIKRDSDETVILIPLKDADAYEEIATGLEKTIPTALRFLRKIEKICWNVGERFGHYQRKTKKMSSRVREVNVVGEKPDKDDTNEEWLVFSRPVFADDGRKAGHVEVAFFLAHDEDKKQPTIRRIHSSPWVVFFPTAIETNLGFLVQGPYRTTSSRDNIPKTDSWNKKLVGETASLLVEALRWLGDKKRLDVEVLQTLPIDSEKFGEESGFATLFKVTKEAVAQNPLLPCLNGGYVSASSALLGGTRKMRELLTPDRLANFYPEKDGPAWLSDDISRAREFYNYLRHEHQVDEVTWGKVLPLLTQDFLEAQEDDWIKRLYEALGELPSLRDDMHNLPLIRLKDGEHVAAKNSDGKFRAFLPGPVATKFDTVRESVCETDDAKKFLHSLGLTRADLVADVTQNILPKYREENTHLGPIEYEDDIKHILKAYATDSVGRKEELLRDLRQTKFVKAVDSADGRKIFSCPGDAYLTAEPLKNLFENIRGVFFVDDSCGCLSDNRACELLRDCGATSHLQSVRIDCTLSREELYEIRRQKGLERETWEGSSDFTLRGFDAVLEYLSTANAEARKSKARFLWDALVDLGSKQPDLFKGKYSWRFNRDERKATFPADFIRKLNEVAWVPDESGELQKAKFVLFDSLGWSSNQFLQSLICFKSPAKEQLAREFGIESDVLDALQKLGVSSTEELLAKLGDSARKQLSDGITASESPALSASGDKPESKPRGREFVSYVAVSPNEEKSDPDGLSHEKRITLEEKAIKRILSEEPGWRRTPTNNPGFDLCKVDEQGNPTQWCEVKAMSGTLRDRPVTMTQKQFDCAREHGNAYWLYVVQCADDIESKSKIVRIQDPAGSARTFTFDHRWLEVDRASP